MGYTTNFYGDYFTFNKKPDPETHTFLTKLAETRRMARKVDPKYGVEGEFYVDGKGFLGQDNDETIINHNQPPSTQPSLWCQWTPNEDGTKLVWDGGEKFYDYIEWLEYIIDKILTPRDYILNGVAHWQGEESSDTGTIYVMNNLVLVLSANVWHHLSKICKTSKLKPEYELKAIKTYLKNKKNLPTLLGLDRHLDNWIAKQLKE